MPSSKVTAKLEANISEALHELLQRAAELQGRTVSEFVVAALHEAAQRTINETEIVHLPPEAQVVIAKALSSSPSLTPALNRAISRRDKLLRSE